MVRQAFFRRVSMDLMEFRSVQLVRDSILPELASLFCHWRFEAGIPYCRAHPPGSIFNVLEYR